MKFFDVFSDKAPSIRECEVLFTDIFRCEVNVQRAFKLLNVKECTVVGPCLFSALGILLTSGDAALPECKARGTARCSRCNAIRIADSFGKSNLTLSALCASCRHASTEVLIAAVLYVIDMDIIAKEADPLAIALQIAAENYQVARRLNLPVEGILSSRHMTLPCLLKTTDLTVWAEAQAQFLIAMRSIEPYTYIRNGGSANGTRKVYSCNERAKKPPVRDESSNKRRRVRASKQRFECGGGISFSSMRSKSSIRIRHTAHHGPHHPHAFPDTPNDIAAVSTHALADVHGEAEPSPMGNPPQAVHPPSVSVPMPAPTPEQQQPDGDNVPLQVVDLAVWFQGHVRDLKDTEIGRQQLRFLQDIVLPRLKRYRTNVDNCLHSRRRQESTECSDTDFLSDTAFLP